MNWIPRFRNVFGKRRYETEMAEELRTHLELREEQLRAAGHSAEEARQAARREFGGVEQIKERCRDGRSLAWLEQFARDLRHGARQLARSPGFTIIAVLSLAIAIGASTTIFTLVNDFLLRALPVRAPEELLLLRNLNGVRGGTMAREEEGSITIDPATGRSGSTSFPWRAFERFRAQSTGLSEVFAFAPLFQANLLIDGQPELNPKVQVVSGNYYQGLGVNAVLGRTLLDSDDRADAAPVVVISDRCWRTRFQHDPAVLGRIAVINRIPTTIVGVTPPGFEGAMQVGESAEFTLPLSLIARLAPENGADRGQSWFWWMRVMGRLAPGASPAQVQAALNPAFQQVAAEGWQAALALDKGPAKERPDLPTLASEPGAQGENDTRKEFAPALHLLMAFVALVLLAACANVANLLLARGAARRGEIAIRLALGAGRARIIRQLLTESLLLGSLSAGLGIALAWSSRGLLLALHPFGHTPVQLDLPLDAHVLGFTVGLAFTTSLLFGLAPALRATRLDLTAEFHGTRSFGSRAQSRLSRGLMVVQVALSLVLLVGTGLILRSLRNLQAVDPGFNTRGLAFFRIEAGSAGYDGPQAAALQARIKERIERVPAVQGVSYSQVGVLARSSWRSSIAVEGYAPPPGANKYVFINQVAPNFFPVLGIPLLAGRGFTGRETPTDPRLVVINQSLARKYFGNADPIGRQIILDDSGSPSAPRAEIIGLVRDAKYNNLRDEFPPTLYQALSQRPGATATFSVRVGGDASAALPAIRAAVREIDPALPVHDLRTLEEGLALLHGQEILFARLLGFFGLVAVALACVGLHGLMSFSVARRTPELGLRLTLGATRGNVMGLILRESAVLVLAGIGLGLLSAGLLARALASSLYGLSPVDPITYGATALLLLVTGLFASSVPALRASRIDPARALREE